MIIRVVAFSDNGRELARKLSDKLTDCVIDIKNEAEDIGAWVESGFEKHTPFIFIGACGIAVRMIAPYAKDKLSDSPVLVMDEKGQYVIPILSGHIGGANEIAMMIANKIDCEPVITTATDVNELFAVDLFAKRNGFKILKRRGIITVSSMLLSGSDVTVGIDEGIDCSLEQFPKKVLVEQYVPGKEYDILITCNEELANNKEASIVLVPKKIVLGIGCKKDKGFVELKNLVESTLESLKNDEKLAGLSISTDDIYAISSIDLKAREKGLLELSQYYHTKFKTFSKDELNSVEGEFEASGFVEETTGVDNVCERAALILANDKDGIVLNKQTDNGMTIAVAVRKPRIESWM